MGEGYFISFGNGCPLDKVINYVSQEASKTHGTKVGRLLVNTTTQHSDQDVSFRNITRIIAKPSTLYLCRCPFDSWVQGKDEITCNLTNEKVNTSCQWKGEAMMVSRVYARDVACQWK